MQRNDWKQVRDIGCSVACKSCCPGKSRWDSDVATIDSDDKPALAVRIDTVRLDERTCELTKEPDTVNLRSSMIDVFDFGDFLPGKKIHVVAAPQVGNQSAQYKAAVKLKWNIGGYGVAAIDLGANGPGGGLQLLNKSAELLGEHEYVTEYAGTHRFIFVGYNANGNPLHVEIERIDVPRLPGIN